MNNKISVYLFGLMVLVAFSMAAPKAHATDVSGTISSSTTWAMSESPYRVVGDVTVAAGATLTIDPGVQVQFQQLYGLWIDGNLHAVGTSGNPITFTGTTETEDWWRAINVQNSGPATLEWCHIAYAGWYENAGLLKSGTGALSLKNSFIRNISGDGLRISSGYALFLSSNNTFSNNNYGVRLGINTSFDDSTSDFDGNNVDVYVDGGTVTRDVTWSLHRDYSVYVSGNITVDGY